MRDSVGTVDDTITERCSVSSMPPDAVPVRLNEVPGSCTFRIGAAQVYGARRVSVLSPWRQLLHDSPRTLQLGLDQLSERRVLDTLQSAPDEAWHCFYASTAWTQVGTGTHRFGWQCHMGDKTRLGKGGGVLFGADANPTRAQMYAVTAAVSFVEHVHRVVHRGHTQVQVGCSDAHVANLASAMAVQADRADTALPARYHPGASDWDLLQELRALLISTTCQYRFSYNPPKQGKSSGQGAVGAFHAEQAKKARETARGATHVVRRALVRHRVPPGEGI